MQHGTTSHERPEGVSTRVRTQLRTIRARVSGVAYRGQLGPAREADWRAFAPGR